MLYSGLWSSSNFKVYTQEMEYKLLQQFTSDKANTIILLSGNTEILTQDVRKTKYFKELFNEQRNKDTR